MYLDFQLLVSAIVLSAVLAFAAVVNTDSILRDRLWGVIHLAIIGAGCAIWLTGFADHSGYFGHGLFGLSLVLVLAPILLMTHAARSGTAGHQERAVKLARWAALLHPSAQWQRIASNMAAFAEPSAEAQYEALGRLEATLPPVQAYATRLNRLRIANAWDEMLTVPPPQSDAPDIVSLYVIYRLRALGEAGLPREMLAFWRDRGKDLHDSNLKVQALMIVATFCGRPDIVERLLAVLPAQDLPPDDEGRLWIVHLARLIAGDDAARPLLGTLAARMADPLRRSYMERRLATPLLVRDVLTAEDDALIDRALAETLADGRKEERRRNTPLTFALIAANIGGFLYEQSLGAPLLGSALAAAGGMWPPLVYEGEWWRLATALFLHAGFAHLAFNMIALLSIGQDVERRFGIWRTGFIYLAGGVLSSLLVFWLMIEDYLATAVLVGASGAVMALFGALLPHAIAEWRRSRAVSSRNHILVLGFIVALQFLSDAAIPQVSMAAHIGGFFAGLVIGAIFILSKR